MAQRVVDRLRADYPHDREEILRATATETMYGACIAFRLAIEDVVSAAPKHIEPLIRRLVRR